MGSALVVAVTDVGAPVGALVGRLEGAVVGTRVGAEVRWLTRRVPLPGSVPLS